MNVDGETDAYAQATHATRILQLTHPMIETPQRGGGGGGGQQQVENLVQCVVQHHSPIQTWPSPKSRAR
jgi:hypothetical protein